MRSMLLWSTILVLLIAGTMIAFRNRQATKTFDSFAHEVRQIAYWQSRGALNLPLEDRILETPSELVDYINKDNQAQGWPNRPVKSEISASVKIQLKQALQTLPAEVKRKIEPLLVGIFFVKDLGGTGYAEYIVDPEKNPVGGFVVFDELVLTRKANDWATWKERSPFVENVELENLQLTIENLQEDTVQNAFQFIALHEFGHIASIGTQMHPPWGFSVSKSGDPTKFLFSSLSWQIKGDEFISLFDNAFALRSEMHFYRGQSKADPTLVYAQLQKTNFPTLYAATHPADDFADSFASYVHVVMMRKPYQISISAKDRPPFLLPACWEEERCKPKRALLEDFLKIGG